MKSVTKLLAVFLVIILVVAAFAGCGKKNEPEDTPEDKTSAAIKETPSPEPKDTPTNTPEDTETPGTETPEPIPPEDTAEPVSETPSPTPETAEGTNADQVLGTVKGNTYTNSFFGFSLTMPEGWYIASREEMAQIFAAYLDSGAEGADIDLETAQILPLLFTATYDPFTYQGTNPNIVCLAQNISQYASMVKDARSLLNIQVQAVKAQGMDMTFGDIEVINIDGQEIARVHGVQNYEGIEIGQTVYSFMKEGFAVLFTLSSYTDEEAQQLNELMGSMTFR